MHVLDLAPEWYRHLATRNPNSPVCPGDPVEDRTWKTYRSKINLFRHWLKDDRVVTMQTLREYEQHLQFEAASRSGRGQKPRTIRASLRPVIMFLEWARLVHGAAFPELLALPEVIRIKCPPLDRPTRAKPSKDHINALFAAAARMDDFTVRDRFLRARALALLSLAIDCGLRRCEILGLDRAHLRTEGEEWRVEVRHGKRKKYREVTLNARARDHIGHYH